MIKHFCDICGKELFVQNTALKNTKLIQRDRDGMNRPLYRTTPDMEICEGCARAICDVMDALKNGKVEYEVKYK